MVTLGVDAHKGIHVAVALDEMGREIGNWSGPNRPTAWQELFCWAVSLGPRRCWGIEGAWNYGRGLAQHLVTAGETVYEVNPRWTAQDRQRARRPGKTDRLDARAVAAVVLREGTGLPVVTVDDETAVLDELVTEREDALAEATRIRNRLHQLLFHIDPAYRVRLPSLRTRAGIYALGLLVLRAENPVMQARAAAVRRLAQRLSLALDHVAEVGCEIKARAEARFSRLTELCGVNLLTAGALAGILGPGRRFQTEAQMAAYAGAAPLETSSAGLVRHRLNRGGNRRLNAILYRIALTQRQHSPQAIAYVARRIAEGKTSREATRALKRYIVRAIWRLWTACLAANQLSSPTGVLT